MRSRRGPGVRLRAVGSFACLVTEQLGAVVLFLGGIWGLYVVGIGMMASFVFMVTGAWLLLVGVESIQAHERDRVSVALGRSNPGQ